MKNTNHYSRRKFLSHTGSAAIGTLFISPLASLTNGCSQSSHDLSHLSGLQHVVVAGKKGRFYAWPANNGMWKWDNGKEILVGHTDGPWVEQEGHNIGHPQLSKLARSTDGGLTWGSEDPDNYVGEDGDPVPSPGNIDFNHRGFALRVAARGYHGTDDPIGRFFISYDRGKTWEGSYRFNELHKDPELEGLEITARTNYMVTGPESCRIFMTARNPELEFASRLDKPFVVETTDGGKSFQFISWVVPWTDQYRAVMPSTVRTRNGNLVLAARRRNPRVDQSNWIDSFVSSDEGRSWSFLSKVGETGVNNGNPPGLTALRDGRLVCIYGNRSVRQILVRYSADEGKNWGGEIVVRENPLNYDIGYPQITQNAEGKIVAMYYIATEERPHSHIAASIWTP
ncbi:MAG: sialidase family protein [Balneolales bacterium]